MPYRSTLFYTESFLMNLTSGEFKESNENEFLFSSVLPVDFFCLYYRVNVLVNVRLIWLKHDLEDDGKYLIGVPDCVRTARNSTRHFLSLSRKETGVRTTGSLASRISNELSSWAVNVLISTSKRINETAQSFSRKEFHIKSFRMLKDICIFPDSTKTYDSRIEYFDKY